MFFALNSVLGQEEQARDKYTFNNGNMSQADVVICNSVSVSVAWGTPTA